jgi:hypothetical protein
VPGAATAPLRRNERSSGRAPTSRGGALQPPIATRPTSHGRGRLRADRWAGRASDRRVPRVPRRGTPAARHVAHLGAGSLFSAPCLARRRYAADCLSGRARWSAVACEQYGCDMVDRVLDAGAGSFGVRRRRPLARFDDDVALEPITHPRSQQRRGAWTGDVQGGGPIVDSHPRPSGRPHEVDHARRDRRAQPLRRRRFQERGDRVCRAARSHVFGMQNCGELPMLGQSRMSLPMCTLVP